MALKTPVPCRLNLPQSGKNHGKAKHILKDGSGSPLTDEVVNMLCEMIPTSRLFQLFSPSSGVQLRLQLGTTQPW